MTTRQSWNILAVIGGIGGDVFLKGILLDMLA